jgi:hypothetical protein
LPSSSPPTRSILAGSMFTRPTGTGTISFRYLCTALAIALLLLA